MLALVTLTTDFGLDDPYVGQLKGVLFARAPEARTIDLCHGIVPGNIAQAAWILETSCAAFPAGTIHLAVVDPGVGTARRAVALRAAGQWFVAPDNGLLTRVLARHPVESAREIEIDRVARGPVSTTFHGRDVFAPAAAHLAAGHAAEGLGPPLDRPIELPGQLPELVSGANAVAVLSVDRFGNVILDADVGRLAGRPVRVAVRGAAALIDARHATYALAVGDRPFLLINSSGYLEIAVAGGSAAQRLGLGAGDRVELHLP